MFEHGTNTKERNLQGGAITSVNIVVAHGLEARPLISMLELQPEKTDGRYLVYSNSAGATLIVSGMGRDAVIAATNYLGEQQRDEDDRLRGWLNLGIAGHRTAEIGSAWLANKITEQISGASAYPPQLLAGFASCKVITVDKPETAYPEDAVYEMEASAFYEVATKFSTAELVQVFKIISDNSSNPVNNIDLAMVPTWISTQENEILDLLSKLEFLVTEYNVSHSLSPAYESFCARYYLTVNQKIQLKRLCQRYRAMGREADLIAMSVSASGTGKQLLQDLDSQLNGVSSR